MLAGEKEMARSDQEEGPRGGPQTSEGKAKSSQNARTHGMTSRKLLLEDEDPQEWEEVKAGWMAFYDTSSPVAKTLAEKVAHDDWLRRRAEFRYDMMAKSLPLDVRQWSADEWHLHELITRYKTTADRTFRASYRDAEQWRRIRRVEGKEDRTEAQQKAVETAPAPAKPRRPLPMSQWARVDVADGRTTTLVHPTNEQVARAMQEKAPDHPIWRFLEFTDGVPPEYYWTTEDPIKRSTKLWHYEQAMRLDTWRQVIARETNGHIGPYEDLEPKDKEKQD
jgi:hypothetical protein